MAEQEAGAEKKGGKAKLILTIVPLLVIALVAVKMTVLQPPPKTAAEIKAAREAAEAELKTKCRLANTVEAATTEPTTTEGPVLTMESVTVNLADGHFLKVGIGLQMAAGTVLETVKEENTGAKPLNYVITTLRTKSTSDLGPRDLEPLRQKLGTSICVDNAGRFLTVYFTDFVSQ